MMGGGHLAKYRENIFEEKTRGLIGDLTCKDSSESFTYTPRINVLYVSTVGLIR